MWIRFPNGCDRISVEQQEFEVEARDGEAVGYCRVPDHFVPKIVGMSLGFAPSDPPEGTDLPDLPKADPLRDGAIADQSREIQVLRDQVSNLRSDVSVRDAQVTSAFFERDQLKLQVAELEAKIADQESELEELREAAPLKPSPALGKSK